MGLRCVDSEQVSFCSHWRGVNESGRGQYDLVVWGMGGWSFGFEGVWVEKEGFCLVNGKEEGDMGRVASRVV